MNDKTLDLALEEVERFLIKAHVYKEAIKGAKFPELDFGKQRSAMKRSSMDLSRVLADLRQGR